MSASTDAIPSPAANSNPKPEVRRRTVATTKMKPNGEIVAEGNDKVIRNGKDLGHTIRGESLVERSKDVSELKKGLATPTVASRRRKPISKPETPKWQTVLSILTKLCLLLVALVWLGQMILKLSNMNGNTTNYSFAALEYDGWFSEVESFVKKTTKMTQVQLEVLDKKFESEIGTVRRELTKKVEEKGVFLENELKMLETRTDDLGKSLGELKDMGLFTNEEFESFKDGLKKRRDLYGSGEDIGLDDVGALAREIVEKEIEKHAADGLGRVDYALASGGARVIMHSEPYASGKANSWFAVGKDRGRVHVTAQKMLEPSFGEPGQCFAMKGSRGFVEIRLRAGIIPQAVTLEHVSKSVAYDRSSAPKDCVVSAWFEGPGEPRYFQIEKNIVILTKFSYDLEKSNAQTFNVETADIGVVNVVRLDFTSNHGSPSLTCIYRFRVHGYEYSTQQYEEDPNYVEGVENAGLR